MKKLLLLLCILIPVCASAQRWKSVRYEVNYGLGATNFLGDLGGSDQIGTHYFKDLNWSETGIAVNVGLKYKLTEYFAARGNLYIGNISGDDANSKEPFRSNRNLSFYSNIIELSANFEASYMKEKLGHRYKLKGIKGSTAFDIYHYFFIGVGVFYFNPQAKYQDYYHDLQPLGTEGQGVLPTRKTYSRVQLAIPLGMGIKRAMSSRWGISLEYGIRKTFTDYIDDVSTTYVDGSIFKDPGAGELANRSPSKNNPADPMYGSTTAGQQRGDSRYTDSYMFAVVSLTYKIKNGRGNLPKF